MILIVHQEILKSDLNIKSTKLSALFKNKECTTQFKFSVTNFMNQMQS